MEDRESQLVCGCVCVCGKVVDGEPMCTCIISHYNDAVLEGTVFMKGCFGTVPGGGDKGVREGYKGVW